tara:strand:- start:1480 stop:1821 length:342 start_codon:yes stop_codon:yes gene_type:complete
MKSIIVSLSKNEEFKEILKGKKSNNRYCTIFFKPLLNKDVKKLNVSFVAKKKLGNAVKRNKIKRKLRNIFDDATKKIKIKYKYSYLLIAKDTILKDKYLNVKETLFRELNKIR